MGGERESKFDDGKLKVSEWSSEWELSSWKRVMKS